MAALRPNLAQFSRMCTRTRPLGGEDSSRALFNVIIRSSYATASKSQSAQKNVKKGENTAKKRKARTTYVQYDLRQADQFSLCDAMRFLRAFEVGQSPTSTKYEIALKLKSAKNGPVVRNRLRLPHPVKTNLKICVICPPNSAYATAARAAGAYLVGEDKIFEEVKNGKIDFDRCICQNDSIVKMNQAGLGRILGPRRMMPSAKTGTVVKNPALAVKEMVGSSEYRERLGVVRMAVGQLGFTPEELQRNIKLFIESVKKDMALLSDKAVKDIAEVVLSSTKGPGFSLNGDFISPDSTITPKDLPRM